MWCPNFVWYSISSGISSSRPSGSTRSTMSLDSCFLCTWSWWWWPYVSLLSAHTSSSTLRITDGEGGEIHYRKGYLQTVKLYYEISYQHVICMDNILLHSLNKTHYRMSESAHVFSGVVVSSAIYQQGFSNGWIFNVSCASCYIHKYSVHGENLANMNMYTLVLHSTCYQLAIQPALRVVTPHSSSCVHVSLIQAMDKFLCRRLHILLCLPLFLLLLSFQNQVSYMHSTFLH